jgi:ribosomal protein L25 (general stress protein Ctc)
VHYRSQRIYQNYLDTVKLPEAREGALVLKNLYDYQEQLLQEIRVIRRNGQCQRSKYPKDKIRVNLTLQEYRLNVLVQNFSLDSTMFRHSLRLTIAIVFAYLLGFLLTSKTPIDFADHCYYATSYG